MLIRILTQNPGRSFTRHIDDKFVQTVLLLSKDGKDPSVQQILTETLNALESESAHDENIGHLLDRWRSLGNRHGSVPRVPQNNPHPLSPQISQDQRVFGRGQLPPPHELVSRVEESKNSGKILMQLLQSTPPEEMMGNDLIKEFAERCQSAQRSMQGFINCDSPPPDDDTLQTLIETNEQLSLSMSRYQRAVLSARRATGASSAGTSPNPEAQAQHQLGGASLQQPPSRPPKESFDRRPQATLFPSTAPSGIPPSLQPGPRPNIYSPIPPTPEAPRLSHTEPAYNKANVPTSDPFADTAERSDYGHQASQSQATRPGQTYFTNGVTQSYMGRQLSAANGLTMHGAGIDEEETAELEQPKGPGAVEVDSDSRVGRMGVDTVTANEGRGVGATNPSYDDDDLYANSPVAVKGTWRDV